jgi:hypothetical protein
MELLGVCKVNKLQVQAVAAVVVIVFAGGILLSGGKVQIHWLKFYSVAVFGALVLLALWDKFIWHLAPIQRLKSTPRDIRGTWKGELRSNWIPSDAESSLPDKTAYLVVRQTASTTSIVLLTDESKSSSDLAKVTSIDGGASLDYMYLNQPKMSVEHRSRMHHGSTSLAITGRPPDCLEGRYWTDRGTQGELAFNLHSDSYVENYEQAESLFR